MIIEVVQGTEEWHEARLGVFTASRVYDLIKGRSGYRAARKNYIAEKICEVLTGERADFVETAPMRWGTEQEPFARAAYEVERGVSVDEVGFVLHATIDRFGASPDGLIGDDGCIEIKCPNTATHLDTLLEGKIKPIYLYQMQTVMECCGRLWCDFVSFDPRMDKKNRLKIIRVYRDEKIIDEIKSEVDLARNNLELLLEALK